MNELYENIFNRVKREYYNARVKHPEFRFDKAGTVIGEEYGELCHELNAVLDENEPLNWKRGEAILTEASHVVVTCLRLMTIIENQQQQENGQ